MGKLNDLDYCYASIVLLEELEKVSYARNERLRQFHEKVHARQSFVAAALAMILPVIVWIYLLTSKVSIFNAKTFAILGPRVVGVFMITALLFLIPYLFLHMVWCQPFLRSFRRLFESVLRANLINDVNGWQAVFAPDIMFYMNVPNTFNMLYNQRKRWAKGGTEAWLTNFKRVAKHPIKNAPKIVMLLDQTGSILWSFYYLIFTTWLILKVIYFVFTNDSEQLVHTLDMTFLFSAFISMVGVWQLVASLALDNHGAKMKYLLFAPGYMVWYWQMNAITIATTFIPAIKTVFGFAGKGTWVSPTRTKMTKKGGDS